MIPVYTLFLLIGLFALIAHMAKKRNHNVLGWIPLNLIITPFLSIAILLIIGEKK